jgi:C1A family cysteine protease
MGINQFTHMTQEEFVKTYLIERPQKSYIVDEKINPPNADIDWTTKGVVSPVKNQGSCGSCWAFSAVAVLESFSLMKGATVNLSEQQLVDCSRAQGNAGCNGGYNIQGLAYVKKYGIASTSQYPYVAKDQTCKMTGGTFKITNVQSATGCNAMNNAVQTRPIGVSVDATNWSPYTSGIFNNCKASINHDVFLVGVTGTYWKIKNSWGKTWGENGFIRLAYGNTCGVCVEASPWVV